MGPLFGRDIVNVASCLTCSIMGPEASDVWAWLPGRGKWWGILPPPPIPPLHSQWGSPVEGRIDELAVRQWLSLVITSYYVKEFTCRSVLALRTCASPINHYRLAHWFLTIIRSYRQGCNIILNTVSPPSTRSQHYRKIPHGCPGHTALLLLSFGGGQAVEVNE